MPQDLLGFSILRQTDLFWLSYKRCDFAGLGVKRVVIEPGWSLKRDIGYGLTSIRILYFKAPPISYTSAQSTEAPALQSGSKAKIKRQQHPSHDATAGFDDRSDRVNCSSGIVVSLPRLFSRYERKQQL
jgi:hypothetical protein